MDTYCPVQIAVGRADEAKGAVLIRTQMALEDHDGKKTSSYYRDGPRAEHAEAVSRHAELSPLRLLEGDTPRLIDEWQITPINGITVRYEVDRRDTFGQFILTGSAVPAEIDASMHTGAVISGCTREP